MSAAPARFTFDLDLGRREERGRMLTENSLAEMLKAARMDGFAQGYAEAEQGTAAVALRRVTDAAEILADRVALALAANDEAHEATIAEAARLALSVGRKLALHLIARQPAAELQALVDECLASLEGVPHLVIRCHPEIAEAIRQSAEARIAVTGFTGRLVVIADPQQALSDGRIEWADGGLSRNLGEISAAIDSAIAEFIRTHAGAAAEETSP